jgi:ribosomal protein S18 acetylase RimI-like enzyme
MNTITRFFHGLKKPTRTDNTRLLYERGETLDDFIIREVRATDLQELAALHVKAWNETYHNVKNPPNYATREYQWAQLFKQADGSWFCFVVENSEGELIGFAKGNAYASDDLPGYSGEVSKIYLLRQYQRLGLGRKLVGYVSRRFLSQGISTMVLFGVPQNPASKFHEILGGEKLYSKNGEFHGGYGWNNLQLLAAVCPID